MQVIWFRNDHEHRNYLLRLGFMRLHRLRAVDYRELPLDQCVRFGFSDTVRAHAHRHTSVVLLRDGDRQIRCLIDSEDSFFWMCPLIAEVDVYFCSGYNADFFERRQMLRPLDWQTEADLAPYRSRAAELIETLGDSFDKVRRYVPIGPSLALPGRTPAAVQKLRNLRHRAHRLAASDLYWQSEFTDFETRYRQLIELRAERLRYDVVLRDTLWGWPRHRQRLHLELARLATRRRVHSQLAWSEPTGFDGKDATPLDPGDFPMITAPVQNYEEMLAQSRLAVLATGFHWGWRSIMMVALMLGLPAYGDPLRLEPWFPMDQFIMFWNQDGSWADLEDHLDAISPARWEEIKRHNQGAYDRFMDPARVATHVIETAMADQTQAAACTTG